MSKEIKELQKQKAKIDEKIEELKRGETKRMEHHKKYHVGSGNKYCSECGMKLVERCPKFMKLGKDCNEFGCSYFEKKMELMRC